MIRSEAGSPAPGSWRVRPLTARQAIGATSFTSLAYLRYVSSDATTIMGVDCHVDCHEVDPDERHPDPGIDDDAPVEDPLVDLGNVVLRGALNRHGAAFSAVSRLGRHF